MTAGFVRLDLETTTLPSLIRSALVAVNRQAENQGIELRVVASDEVPAVNVDREKVAWVVCAVVGNALRYLPRGTDVDAGGSIVVEVAPAGEHVAIAVQDDGPGIDKERLERMFHRGGEEHVPALALSLVRDIVVAHGGRVEVQSQSGEEDHYTCVTILLPAAK